MSVETKSKIDELHQSTWLDRGEAAQFLGKSTKGLDEFIELGYFKLSNEKDLLKRNLLKDIYPMVKDLESRNIKES